jgi:hypothetical protein
MTDVAVSEPASVPPELPKIYKNRKKRWRYSKNWSMMIRNTGHCCYIQ